MAAARTVPQVQFDDAIFWGIRTKGAGGRRAHDLMMGT
jgi:hypothetical protein